MKSIAFIFMHPPHGSSAGREGLDALLAVSALSKNLGVFFLADGVFQLLANQHPEKILARNYISTFGILPLYDIKDCYVCAASLRDRGLTWGKSVVKTELLEPHALRMRLADYDQIFTF